VSAGDALTHPWLTVRVQIVLGLLFVAAALPKVVDPPSFAHMIYNYRIVPASLVNIMALVMPWVELLAGMALILGLWRRSANALMAILLLIFIVAITINLARGNVIDCGCFDVRAAGRSNAQRLADMKLDILRDIGMLLLSLQLWYGIRRQEMAPG
jgi:uncharacterized membrane protein YphA (DoxX/SURF4 family)